MSQHATAVKAALLDLIDKMNVAARNGVIVEFQLIQDPLTKEHSLAKIAMYQQIKDN